MPVNHHSHLEKCSRIRLVGRPLLAVIMLANGATAESGRPVQLSLETSLLQTNLMEEAMLSSVPPASSIGVAKITAFEDHDFFVYVHGQTGAAPPRTTLSHSGSSPRVLRKLIFFRPNVIVVDDQILGRFANDVRWSVNGRTPNPPTVQDMGELIEGERRTRIRRLKFNVVEVGGNNECRLWNGLPYAKRFDLGETAGWKRLIHILAVRDDNGAPPPIVSVAHACDARIVEIRPQADDVGRQRVFRLWLPESEAPGRIEISRADGTKVLPERLFPHGIMPPGAAAARRRLQWDLPYQREGMATWDIQKPSPELRRVLLSGVVKPCRAVEIGCGSGNDAIYLASQGFDVTAIDISPTALRIAQQKALQAGVKVKWILADVLKPPDLGKFDFLYDRGCYHDIRRHDLSGYLAAIRTLTHDASRLLILAGSANADSYWRFHGPPRVKKKDLLDDFAVGFKLVKLSEFRFDPAPPDQQGSLAWSILLESSKCARHPTSSVK